MCTKYKRGEISLQFYPLATLFSSLDAAEFPESCQKPERLHTYASQRLGVSGHRHMDRQTCTCTYMHISACNVCIGSTVSSKPRIEITCLCVNCNNSTHCFLPSFHCFSPICLWWTICKLTSANLRCLDIKTSYYFMCHEQGKKCR